MMLAMRKGRIGRSRPTEPAPGRKDATVPRMDSVQVSIGCIVLDRPDQSGQFIAKDFAGGWAYIVADADGDKRFRGQGACAGGLATALRYAFLSAVGCVPDCRRITVCVDTAQAHHLVVRLATVDARVVAVVAGRAVTVVTRPHDRSSHQVRLAAERAATAALRAREHAETPIPELPDAELPDPELAEPIRTEDRPSWRRVRPAADRPPPPGPQPTEPGTAGNTRALAQWLHDFENRVESVQTGLQGISR